jgi:choline transport protein
VVWTTFLNESGWVNSIAFLTGLVNPNYMYAGIDGAIHLAEECRNAAVVVPRALLSTITIGFVTSFIFAIVMLYCTNDLQAVVSTATGYVLNIFAQLDLADFLTACQYTKSGDKAQCQARLLPYSSCL